MNLTTPIKDMIEIEVSKEWMDFYRMPVICNVSKSYTDIIMSKNLSFFCITEIPTHSPTPPRTKKLPHTIQSGPTLQQLRI